MGPAKLKERAKKSSFLSWRHWWRLVEYQLMRMVDDIKLMAIEDYVFTLRIKSISIYKI